MQDAGTAGKKDSYYLFEAIKANDETAMKELYLTNYPKIEDYVLKNGGTKDEAKDIFQEAFLILWRKIKTNRFEPLNDSSLDGFLYQVSRNKWLDQLRSAHHNKVVVMNEDKMNFSVPELTEDVDVELVERVRDRYKKLGLRCKQVLSAFYFDRKPMKEIAADFGWTEATARNNKYRCIQKLRELLNDK